MSTYLITGAGRGIGLELTKQLSQLDEKQVAKVFATTRELPSKALSELIEALAGRVVHVPCQVTSTESIEQAVQIVEGKVGSNGLDVLVNNVGTLSQYPNGIHTMPDTQLLDQFDVNVVSVHRMTSAFLPLLKKGKAKRIFNISTTLGSISLAPTYAWAPVPGYKITKAALNMLTVQYALELASAGFTVLAISPGWLKTDLGSSYADLRVETGVRATVEVMMRAGAGAGKEMNGRFCNVRVEGWEEAEGPNRYDGGEVAW